MSDIYDVMAEEARQSYFHLENMIMSLDSKAFGVITADALLFSVFTYVIDKSNTLFLYSTGFNYRVICSSISKRLATPVSNPNGGRSY